MAFKVGDVVQLKSGGARMSVSKLFKSPEGREMVQCTWFDKKPREHRAAFVIELLGSRGRRNAARQARRTRLTDLAARRACECSVLPANAFNTITSPWDWCRGRDAMTESAAVRLRRFIAIRLGAGVQ